MLVMALNVWRTWQLAKREALAVRSTPPVEAPSAFAQP
jgi:hypothetical protein